MDTSLSMFIVLISATAVLGQRPFFAGSRPIGYPETPNRTTEGLADRFGEVDGTTPKLPIEANGDLDLIDRLSKLPVDQQPFWFINWQAYETHRENPQTYPQRPNQFIDPIPSPNNANSGSVNSGVIPNSASNSNTATPISDNTANRFGDVNSNSASTSKPSNSNSDVKPTPTSTSNENNKVIDSEVKPATADSVSTINSEPTPNPGSTVNYGTTANPSSTADSNSKSGSKLQQVTPVTPSPVAAPSTVRDETTVDKGSSGNRLNRLHRIPMYGH